MGRSNASDRVPVGVRVRKLETHADERGTLTELFRESWHTRVEIVQWNAVSSQKDVLRGVHVHPVHDDYLVLLRGRLLLGLHDLRPDSPTAGCSALVELVPEAAQVALVPHGVAHGFFFPEPSYHVYGVSHYWDPSDELGCRWDDPALAIPWPRISPAISRRDADLPSLDALRGQLESARSPR
jgi:dTDP-4-dehydrorhamnose 3,5-epimerase